MSFSYLEFAHDVAKEVGKVEEAHPTLSSFHEAYGLLLEEMDELWDQIKLKEEKRDLDNMYNELVQIAGLCYRTAKKIRGY